MPKDVNRTSISTDGPPTPNTQQNDHNDHPLLYNCTKTCNNPTFLSEANHLLIKIALFSNQSCLWSNTLLRDQKKVCWINRPDQIEKVETCRLRTRGVWNIGVCARVCERACGLIKCLIAAWGGRSWSHGKLHVWLLLAERWRPWQTAQGQTQIKAMTDESREWADRGERQGVWDGVGMTTGQKTEMKRTAAFGKRAVRRIWLQKRK